MARGKYGRQYLATVGLVVGIDGVMVVLFIACLLAYATMVSGSSWK
jgi:hypothetical protein